MNQTLKNIAIAITLASITLTACKKKDNTAPEINLIGGNETVSAGNTYIDKGATATDNKDGDITKNVVSNGVVNTAIAGTYTISYNIKDAAGNPATEVRRSITVTDGIKPAITLIGGSAVNVSLNVPYADAGATATDNSDGNITYKIVVNSTSVNVNVEGIYLVNYTVTDLSGNTTTVIRAVTVKNDAFALGGNYNIVTTVGGSTYNYTDAVSVSNTENNKITVTKFSGYTGASIYMIKSGTSITIPSQTVVAGGASRRFAGSGNLTSTGMNLSYTETTNNTTASCIDTYTQQ